MFSFRAEGFSCSLDVIWDGGLVIRKWQFLIEKKFQLNIFPQFLVI
jgi:hypothetical protein